MRIPDQVKVGGKTYHVNITDRLTLGAANYSAEIVYTDLEINITPQAPEKMEADFIHELTHAILDHTGQMEQDEREVDAFAQALHMVIRDNPEIFSEDDQESQTEELEAERRALENAVADQERLRTWVRNLLREQEVTQAALETVKADKSRIEEERDQLKAELARRAEADDDREAEADDDREAEAVTARVKAELDRWLKEQEALEASRVKPGQAEAGQEA